MLRIKELKERLERENALEARRDSLISEYVDLHFRGDRIGAEVKLRELFPIYEPFGGISKSTIRVVSRDGIFLEFNSRREMLEHFGY